MDRLIIWLFVWTLAAIFVTAVARDDRKKLFAMGVALLPFCFIPDYALQANRWAIISLAILFFAMAALMHIAGARKVEEMCPSHYTASR